MINYHLGNKRWTYGMVVESHQNGTPLRWMLGPCPECGGPTTNYGSSYSCNDDLCANSCKVFLRAPRDPMPAWWGTEISVKLDGKSWCATGPEFVNLQESKAGFGNTPQLAVEELLSNRPFRRERKAYEYCVYNGYKEDTPEFTAAFGAWLNGDKHSSDLLEALQHLMHNNTCACCYCDTARKAIKDYTSA